MQTSGENSIENKTELTIVIEGVEEKYIAMVDLNNQSKNVDKVSLIN